MSPPKPEERRRRYHKRSRNGCIDCKRKHIRCDERKPLCTNCLVKGDSCGYADTQEASPQPTSIKVEDDEYWDSETVPMQGMSQGHLMMPNQQVQVQQGSDASAFQYDHYAQGGDAGDRMQDPYYWSQGMASDAQANNAMGYTMGSQQQMYNWRDMQQMDPTGGHEQQQQQQQQQQASYWGQDPNQADPGSVQQDRHGEHKSSSRRDGGGRRRH